MRVLLIYIFLFTFSANAQEWGLTAGVTHSNAKSRVPDTTTAPRLSFRGGISTSFLFLNDEIKIKTGLIYTQRRFEVHEGDDSYTYDWHYLDIPALAQVKYNDMIGFFGGAILAVNLSDEITPSLGDNGTRALSPIFHGGVSFLFDNMYGFDLFYEHGFDNLDDNVAHPSAFGINFIYYFL